MVYFPIQVARSIPGKWMSSGTCALLRLALDAIDSKLAETRGAELDSREFEREVGELRRELAAAAMRRGAGRDPISLGAHRCLNPGSRGGEPDERARVWRQIAIRLAPLFVASDRRLKQPQPRGFRANSAQREPAR